MLLGIPMPKSFLNVFPIPYKLYFTFTFNIRAGKKVYMIYILTLVCYALQHVKTITCTNNRCLLNINLQTSIIYNTCSSVVLS